MSIHTTGKPITFEIKVYVPGRYEHDPVNETIATFEQSTSGHSGYKHPIDMNWKYPSHVVTPGQSDVELWVWANNQPIFQIYHPQDNSWGQSGKFSWWNVMLRYSVRVCYNDGRKPDTHDPFGSFKISISSIQMHDTGVGYALQRDRELIENYKNLVDSKEKYYRETLEYEDSKMKRDRKKRELESQNENWKDNFAGLLDDVINEGRENDNWEPVEGWIKDFSYVLNNKKQKSNESDENHEDVCSNCKKQVSDDTSYSCVVGCVFCNECGDENLSHCTRCDQQICFAHLDDDAKCSGCIKYLAEQE